ncbi:hypothetical protein ABF162_25625 (plasmid) [Vibrio coralliilyticus]|uniref:hypothetical protein n=1 Tax=Vibrio coralliilyticus TaxID=190893 RepID=UPI0005127C2D|nr:hypothetical protein [Vibrio coralliilyticus]AIS58381.1 hypothetical protein JV59_25550 [Vibrio coralliilyticus]
MTTETSPIMPPSIDVYREVVLQWLWSHYLTSLNLSSEEQQQAMSLLEQRWPEIKHEVNLSPEQVRAIFRDILVLGHEAFERHQSLARQLAKSQAHGLPAYIQQD